MAGRGIQLTKRHLDSLQNRIVDGASRDVAEELNDGYRFASIVILRSPAFHARSWRVGFSHCHRCRYIPRRFCFHAVSGAAEMLPLLSNYRIGRDASRISIFLTLTVVRLAAPLRGFSP